MAYRRKRSKVTMGKAFRTRRGRYGCYKYVNGRRVGFVAKSGGGRYRKYSRRPYGVRTRSRR